MNACARFWVFLVFLFPFAGWTCENQFVRVVAFQEDRDIHRLSLILDDDNDANQPIQERLEQWMIAQQPGLNVGLHVLSVQDPNVEWRELGIPSAPPSVPVVVFSGFRSFERSAFYIDHWEPAPSDEELELLKTSPVREAIAHEVVQNLAVLLVIPALAATHSASSNPAMGDMVDRVVESYAHEPLKLSKIVMDRSDERERVLLSFLGVKADGPDWLAVVFGRGKVMMPLQGENISESNLQNQLDELQGDCSCLRSTLSLGVDLPMVWEPERQDSVVTLASLIPPDTLYKDDNLLSFSTWNSLSTAIWSFLSLFLIAIFSGFAIVWKRGISN